MKRLCLLVFLGIVLACSSSSSNPNQTTTGTGTGGVPPGSAADVACADYADRMCKFEESCDPAYYGRWNGDRAACVTRMREECSANLTANGTGATPAQLQACATTVSTYSCDDVLVSRKWPSECDARGKLVDGAPCGVSAQCQGGRCSNTLGEPCGTCLTPALEGSPCTMTADCARNLPCLNQVCVARVPLGGQCQNARCLGVLPCVGRTSGNGICSRWLGAGVSCDIDSATDPCNPYLGLVCDATTKTCMLDKVPAIGEPCGAVVDPDSGAPISDIVCGIGAFCDDPGSRTCRPVVKDGAPCTDSRECLLPAQCINSVCAITDPNTCR